MLITEIDASNFSDFDHHEKLLNCLDDQTGLRAYIAIHNRNLGPALGGCRMWPYPSNEAAIKDVLRLSRGMTYKSAIAELALGGGKAVIVGDPRQKKPELFRAMGRFINSLEGAYITAEDAGTSVADLQHMATETPYVTGIATKQCVDGNVVHGDPSPSTAYGVFVGLRAAVQHAFGTRDLSGVRVAVQGVGNVGRRLVNLLVNAGAIVTVSDISDDAVQSLKHNTPVTITDNLSIHTADVDVFSPCALGGAITRDNVAEIKASVIAGAANNQLADPEAGLALHRLGKVYAPDYVINAGGIIDVQYERIGYDHENVINHINRLADTLQRIFMLSEAQNTPAHIIADRLAEKRFLHKADSQVA